MADEVMKCTCGKEMLLYPNAYLCLKCDSNEIKKLALEHFHKTLKEISKNE